MTSIQDIKNRYTIIGNSPLLERAIDIARQVAPTDLSVLITGESGTGKEVFPQIIHQFSARKHNGYIPVNCGAIPEGTIDSELFGHEKGSFTGAYEARKGYFEVANTGTIFLDEVAELPLTTQVRLLRVLEAGEYIRVGSSKVQKTDVRIVAATNINIAEAVRKGKFREDLFYRLNTVPVMIPPLRERKQDIALLFRKFAVDFAASYKTTPIQLSDEALRMIENYSWPGNIRQLKNITEQISILEKEKRISAEAMLRYLPQEPVSGLPVLLGSGENHEYAERDIMYKVIFDMRKDISDVKRLLMDLYPNDPGISLRHPATGPEPAAVIYDSSRALEPPKTEFREPASVENESLSIAEKEKELILKALDLYKNNRRKAAKELGISERTLYRKITEYNLE
ncbi:MAG: sigma-54-dependent Fis family transcriptional regulator [Bacteroidetes bacterium]|nr:sigma-54-dependent Fis family transcriptional regulator [Bacteroidota bacterium]